MTDAWAISESAPPLPVGARPAVGLSFSFSRGARDFARAVGVGQAVRDSITQILGVRADDGRAYGELPWRPDFGSLLHRLQYLNVDDAFAALARTRVVNAIAQWEPRCRVRDVSVRREDVQGGTRVVVSVLYDLVSPGTGQVVGANQRVDVPVSG